MKPYAFLASLGLLFATLARGGLAFSLTPATASGVGSNEVTFFGALTNTSLTDSVYLNDIRLSFTGVATNYFAADTNIFFANVPGVMLTGETYTDRVFGVVISPSIPPGIYSGTAIIAGGLNIFAMNLLASQTFQISLPPATLRIAPAGTNFALSWPSPPAGFVLEQNPDLTTTNWAVATNTPAASNGWEEVIFPSLTGNHFYRLAYP